jgi:putative polyhydroxyalkanoate system protein
MSQIHLQKNHSLGGDEARKTAEKLADRLAAEYKAKWQWHNNDLKLTAKGVQGLLHVGHDMVDIKVDLGMMLRPFKGKIESRIKAQLDDILDKENLSAL